MELDISSEQREKIEIILRVRNALVIAEEPLRPARSRLLVEKR